MKTRTERVLELAHAAVAGMEPLSEESSPTEVISAMLTVGLMAVHVATDLGQGEQVRAGVERMYSLLPPLTGSVN